MTKAQIKAELRRSAMEDESPLYECKEKAFFTVMSLAIVGDGFFDVEISRWFFLLVAEAL